MPIGGALRVKALQPSRRRAGFAFSSNPREIAFEELGEGLAGFIRLVMICEDPFLQTVLVNGDEELPVDADVLAEMKGVLEAEKLRVDPANPPEPITDLMTIRGDGPTQAGGTDAIGPLDGEALPPAVLAAGADVDAVGNDTLSDVHASSAGPTTADKPASESQPAGEETASPAAEPKPRTNTRREKAKA